jgi:antitoxin (DNA-binding transcriptional repressor) of toxin-antitoxin stability system
MRQTSIQGLKAGLSAFVAQAEAGETILVTRHHKVVAQLGPARPEAAHRGARVGRGRLEPALRRATRGRYLPMLLDDRGDR